MTREEKAKAYDEALEWMRKVYPTLTGADKEDVEYYFPEVKESEDERIGNVIYCIVRDNKEVKRILEGNGVSVDNALAYLEKQKEQKPRWEINNPHTTKWTKEMIDEKFEELVEEYHKQKPVVTHGETYHVGTLGTQQVIAGKMPQKSAEWSEEDKDKVVQYLHDRDGGMLWSKATEITRDILDILRP